MSIEENKVSDHASSASWTPRSTRHTRSTVPPCCSTTFSNGCFITQSALRP